MTTSSHERLKSSAKAATDPVITFGSLFAGIGGFDLGFERAGMACKWQVEIDDYANRVLAKHWPAVQRERDILHCGRHNLGSVDVICGGFPCQDISYAGRGAGLDGERSGLFFEAVRVVCELQPRCVVLENVAALLNRGLDRVLGTLAEIGYDAEWHCVPAAAVGAPHIRDRVFVLGWNTNGSNDHSFKKRDQKNAITCGIGSRCDTGNSAVLADATEYRWQQRNEDGGRCGKRTAEREKCRFGSVRKNVADARRRAITDATNGGRWWQAEPDVGRVAHGVPAWVDRLRGLGNAVVPQVAEFVAREFVLPMFQSEGTECT